MTWDTPYGPRVLEGSEGKLLKHALAAMVDVYEMDSRSNLEPTEYGVMLFDELPWPDRLSVLETVGRSLLCNTTHPISSSAVLDACVAAIFSQVLQEIDCEIEHADEFPLQASHVWREMASDAFSESLKEEMDIQESEYLPSESTDTPSELPEWLHYLDSSDGLRESADSKGLGEGEMPQCEEPSWPDSLEDYGFSFDFDDDDEDPFGSSIYESPPSAECTDMETWHEVINALMDRILADRDFHLADRVLDAPPNVAMELRRTLGIRDDYFVTPPPSARDTPMRLAAKLRRMAGVST